MLDYAIDLIQRDDWRVHLDLPKNVLVNKYH